MLIRRDRIHLDLLQNFPFNIKETLYVSLTVHSKTKWAKYKIKNPWFCNQIKLMYKTAYNTKYLVNQIHPTKILLKCNKLKQEKLDLLNH